MLRSPDSFVRWTETGTESSVPRSLRLVDQGGGRRGNGSWAKDTDRSVRVTEGKEACMNRKAMMLGLLAVILTAGLATGCQSNPSNGSPPSSSQGSSGGSTSGPAGLPSSDANPQRAVPHEASLYANVWNGYELYHC